jgi:4-carboxymuconolactone decarboxylase
MNPSSPGGLALCRFAAAMAVQDMARAARAVAVARRAGVARRAAEEAALMLVLYAGYPAALEALRLLNQNWPGSAAPSREGTPRAWRRRGLARCQGVYGVAFPKLLASVRSLHPDLAVWMIENGYGRVLSRPRLDGRTREYVTVSVLAATGWGRQLVSHLRGARRLGGSTSAIRRAFLAGISLADPEARRTGREAWREYDHRFGRWRRENRAG